MGRLTTRKVIHRARIESHSARTRHDVLAVEEPLEIRIGQHPYVVTMRTPGHDVELATGFLFTEGVITAADDVGAAMHCGGPGSGGGENTYNVLDLTLRVPPPAPKPLLTTSACGVCGKDSIAAIRTISRFDPRADTAPLTLETLGAMPQKLRAGQKVFDRTGGTHAAGLFTYDGEMLAIREDVGRHNAVDKVIGWAVMNGRVPLQRVVLQVSGRASFEITQKAAMAGIPVLGAVSAPSSLAVEVAQETGITLAGFMREATLNVYTHGHRLGLGANGRAGQ